jgi:DNA-binding GntR family transcriptional regulator
MKDSTGGSEQGLERKTLSSQLYEILEGKVLNGELVPGTRLSEEAIAETFKVSRSPAREALIDLEKFGLAVRVGARDRMITIPTREMIAAKFDLWWIIDAGRTYLSALSATEKDFTELRQYVYVMVSSVKARDTKRYRSACEKWHKKFVTVASTPSSTGSAAIAVSTSSGWKSPTTVLRICRKRRSRSTSAYWNRTNAAISGHCPKRFANMSRVSVTACSYCSIRRVLRH